MDQLVATWRPKAPQRKVNAALGRWFSRQTDQQTDTNQNAALDQLRLSICLFSRLNVVRTVWNPAAEEPGPGSRGEAGGGNSPVNKVPETYVR